MIERCPQCDGDNVCYFLKPQSEITTITCQWCDKSVSAETKEKAEMDFMKVDK